MHNALFYAVIMDISSPPPRRAAISLYASSGDNDQKVDYLNDLVATASSSTKAGTVHTLHSQSAEHSTIEARILGSPEPAALWPSPTCPTSTMKWTLTVLPLMTLFFPRITQLKASGVLLTCLWRLKIPCHGKTDWERCSLLSTVTCMC